MARGLELDDPEGPFQPVPFYDTVPKEVVEYPPLEVFRCVNAVLKDPGQWWTCSARLTAGLDPKSLI